MGRGAFGKVHCIQDVETKILYAIKVMNKERILEKGALSLGFEKNAGNLSLSSLTIACHYSMVLNLCLYMRRFAFKNS